jgi:mannitol operon transcriptional antiterminator
MTSLTTRQRDLLQFLLTTETAIGTADMGRQLGLSARQVSYNLKTIKFWLARRNAMLKVVPGVGVEVACPQDEKQALLEQLLSESAYQLVLSAAQRQQLLALHLLTASEPLILYQLQRSVQVSRSTILKDLALIEKWLERFGVRLDRRPNYGCSLVSSELAQRQALVSMLWGDIPFGDPMMAMTYTTGLSFSLANETTQLPIVAQVNEVVKSWDTQSALGEVAFAESQLGWRLTDNAVIHLALAFAILLQRTQSGWPVECDRNELVWLQAQSVWPVSVNICRRLGLPAESAQLQHEAAAIAMHLLASVRNDKWPSNSLIENGFVELIENLMEEVANAYAIPDLRYDSALRNGLAGHIIPACMRQRFGLWSPPLKHAEGLSEKYAVELAIAHQLASQVTTLTGAVLPQNEINNLVLLLRAAFIRKRPTSQGRVIVICPSGMATTQLLVARLKARFPRLGPLETLSLRVLNAEKIESAQLIITTVPLYPIDTQEVKVIQVHPLLLPEDIDAIMEWLA